MELFRTSVYERGLKRLARLGASDADVGVMEAAIVAAPEAGKVIPGSGGLRKARFGYGGKGKSGGGRTIYYVQTGDGFLYLLTIYAKVDQATVSRSDLRRLKALAKEISGDQ